MVLALEGHAGLAGAALAAATDRDAAAAADALHQLEVLSLEGSGRGRGLLPPF